MQDVALMSHLNQQAVQTLRPVESQICRPDDAGPTVDIENIFSLSSNQTSPSNMNGNDAHQPWPWPKNVSCFHRWYLELKQRTRDVHCKKLEFLYKSVSYFYNHLKERLTSWWSLMGVSRNTRKLSTDLLLFPNRRISPTGEYHEVEITRGCPLFLRDAHSDKNQVQPNWLVVLSANIRSAVLNVWRFLRRCSRWLFQMAPQ